ncbi:MAG: 1-acyl-sn-glycerol-3-phosphate acyltransferase [Candidatus Nealsonbacteria bacterium]
MLDFLLFHISWIVFALIVLVVFFLVSLGITLILIRRTINGLAREYYIGIDKAIHSGIGWLIAPIVKGFLLSLRARGKLIIYQQEPIHWEEKPLFVANHPCPELQDVFIDLVEIFFLRPRNFINPVAYFPSVPAEKTNFANRWYGGAIKLCTIAVERKSKKRGITAVSIAMRHINNGGTIISYVEGTRTKKALEVSKSPKGNILGKLTNGATYLSLQTNRPIVALWKKIEGCENVPAKDVNFSFLAKGILRLYFDPKVKMFYDFGATIRPDATIKFSNKKERDLAIAAYSERIKEALLATADKQTDRLKER